MPSVGTPLARIAGSIAGASSTSVLSGPPERMNAAGARAASAAQGVSKGTISQYDPSSRVRRAMSWLYCAPKSRMKTTRGGVESGRSGGRLQGFVVIGLLCDFRNDLHVLDVLFLADDDDRARQKCEFRV